MLHKSENCFCILKSFLCLSYLVIFLFEEEKKKTNKERETSSLTTTLSLPSSPVRQLLLLASIPLHSFYSTHPPPSLSSQWRTHKFICGPDELKCNDNIIFFFSLYIMFILYTKHIINTIQNLNEVFYNTIYELQKTYLSNFINMCNMCQD